MEFRCSDLPQSYNIPLVKKTGTGVYYSKVNVLILHKMFGLIKQGRNLPQVSFEVFEYCIYEHVNMFIVISIAILSPNKIW